MRIYRFFCCVHRDTTDSQPKYNRLPPYSSPKLKSFNPRLRLFTKDRFSARYFFISLQNAQNICINEKIVVILCRKLTLGGVSRAGGVFPLRRKPLLPLQWENAQGWGSRHIFWRLLTLVFDSLKPRKFQFIVFENKAVVDAHGRIQALACAITVVRAWWFIYAAWVSACLFESFGFPRTSVADKQEKRSAFLMSGTEFIAVPS